MRRPLNMLAAACLAVAVSAAAGAHTAVGSPAARAAAPRILYSSDWSGRFEVYAADPTGRRPSRQLTSGGAAACARPPASGPCGFMGAVPATDGTRVLFWDGALQSLRRDLYVARPDGRGRRRLGRAEYVLPPAVWSPDSRQVAYAAPDGIHVASANGSRNVRVPTSSAGDLAPAWSPDGRSLAFVHPHAGDGAHDLVVVRGRTRSVVARGERGLDFAWSPAGSWIAYRTSAPRIDLASPDGTRRRALSAVGNLFGLSWSPDGRVLAFSDREGLKLADAATWRVRRVSEALAHELAWSPDGRRLAYASAGTIHVVDVRTGALRVLKASSAGGLAWSPDGRSLAYLARTLDAGANLAIGDLLVTSLDGRTRTVVRAAGALGGSLGPPVWTRPPAGVRYRPPAARSLAKVTANGLEALWPIERISADGGRVAFAACGDVFTWTPASQTVVQAEATTSLSPACTSAQYYTSFRLYSLAAAGGRVAYGTVYGGNARIWWLGGTPAGRPGPVFTLGRDSSTNGPAYAGDLVGELVGQGDVLVFSSWREAPGSGPATARTALQEVRRALPEGCPCPVLASSPGPLVPFDVDGGRVVAGGDNETWLVDRDGTRLLSIAVSPAAAQLEGRDLVLLRRGELRHHDAVTGALVRTWPLPDVPSGPECASPNLGRCLRPQLVLQDLARGLVAYVLDGQVRLVRLADGATSTVAAGSAARFLDGGLVYADGRRLRLVPFAQLPLR